MLTLLFFKKSATNPEEAMENGTSVDFTSDGFKLLIDTAIFQLTHEPTPSGLQAIEVGGHRPLLKEMFHRYPQKNKQDELLKALEDCDYVTADL